MKNLLIQFFSLIIGIPVSKREWVGKATNSMNLSCGLKKKTGQNPNLSLVFGSGTLNPSNYPKIHDPR